MKIPVLTQNKKTWTQTDNHTLTWIYKNLSRRLVFNFVSNSLLMKISVFIKDVIFVTLKKIL